MGNSHAQESELLAAGERYEKAGLLAKALEAYAEARRTATEPVTRAQAWRREAFVHHGRGAWEKALAAASESAEVAREIGRGDLLAEALNAEAAVYFGRGELDEALPLYQRMLDLTDEPRIRGFALQNMGILYARRDDPDQAMERLEAAYREFERAAHVPGKAHVLNNQAAVLLDRGHHTEAEAVARRAMKVARKVEDLDLHAIASLNRAEALQALGRSEQAESAASIALGQFEISGNRWRRVACLRILGDLNRQQGDAEVARRFWSRGLELAKEVGASLEVRQLEDRLDELEAGERQE
jgi:tetratricopeptide (TPR) repeat protein